MKLRLFSFQTAPRESANQLVSLLEKVLWLQVYLRFIVGKRNGLAQDIEEPISSSMAGHVHRAEDGEKHIADVKTYHGRVIEFQHSYLKPVERRSRQAVVDNSD